MSIGFGLRLQIVGFGADNCMSSFDASGCISIAGDASLHFRLNFQRRRDEPELRCERSLRGQNCGWLKEEVESGR
eukprot:2008656-Rhodomonas_salina.2